MQNVLNLKTCLFKVGAQNPFINKMSNTVFDKIIDDFMSLKGPKVQGAFISGVATEEQI